MSNTEMYSLSFLPLDKKSDFANLEDELNYREQVNASILVADNAAAISKQISLLRNNLKIDELVTVADLNVALESYLYLLLFTSSVVSLDKKKDTDHYKKYSLLVPQKNLPNKEWLSELTYTNRKTWFGPYGSPLYELRNYYFVYNNPSELANTSFLNFISSLQLSNIYLTSCLDYFKDEDESSDYFLYAQHLKLLEDLDLTVVIDRLKSLEQWFSTAFDNNNRYLVERFLDNGLYADTLKQLPYRFLHQQLSTVEIECLNNLILRVKSAEDTDNELYKTLIDILPLSTPNNWFSVKSQLLLERLAPPGGYNYLLLQFAAVMLNRAYCLTHYQRIDQSLSLDTANSTQLSRVARLLYYSAYLLKKTNLYHLRMYGNNLNSLLQIESLPTFIDDVFV